MLLKRDCNFDCRLEDVPIFRDVLDRVWVVGLNFVHVHVIERQFYHLMEFILHKVREVKHRWCSLVEHTRWDEV